jgi:hypothetical protein
MEYENKDIATFNCKMLRSKYTFLINGLNKLKQHYEVDSNSRMLELLIADALTGIDPQD